MERIPTIIEINKTDNKIEKTLVGVVIFNNEDEVLLLKRDADDFMNALLELPGGEVVDNDIMHSLVSEVKDKTNLNVISVDEILPEFDYTSGSGKKTRQLNFVVTVANYDIKINNEDYQTYMWHKVDAFLDDLNISKETRDVIYATTK